MDSIDKYIQSAFRKIMAASIKNKGCRLTFDECRAIVLHDGITGVIVDYDQWEFDENGSMIEVPIKLRKELLI